MQNRKYLAFPVSWIWCSILINLYYSDQSYHHKSLASIFSRHDSPAILSMNNRRGRQGSRRRWRCSGSSVTQSISGPDGGSGSTPRNVSCIIGRFSKTLGRWRDSGQALGRTRHQNWLGRWKPLFIFHQILTTATGHIVMRRLDGCTGMAEILRDHGILL